MQKQRFTRDLDRGNSIQDLTGENAVIDEYIDREAAAPARCDQLWAGAMVTETAI
jgi:hypothetical protein